MKKSIVSILAISTLINTNCLVNAHAAELGKINANANIECNFNGDIYIIVADSSDNRKLILLSESNNYNNVLNNLDSGDYTIKEVHIYNNDDSRSELTNADYVLEYDNLDINEFNQNLTISLELKNTDKNNDNNIDNSISSNTSHQNIVESTAKEQEDVNKELVDKNIDKENELRQQKSVARRKKIYFFNFVLDGFLILGLSSIWFFKVRNKEKKDE